MKIHLFVQAPRDMKQLKTDNSTEGGEVLWDMQGLIRQIGTYGLFLFLSSDRRWKIKDSVRILD